MPTVPDIHRRGTRADQATVASPPLTVGTLYFVTDEGVTERWDGAAWEAYSGLGGGGTTPGTHAATHQAGGADAIPLDTLAAPTDVTTLNASASAHGLLPKLSGTSAQFLDGSGAWSTPAAGLPGAHASTHASGGSDPVAVTGLAGFPGGSTTFLRADGTFATPAAGTPTAHHTSHETGGSDAIAALSAAVLTSGTVPDARFPATLPAASGANLTTLNASNLSSGTVPSARLPARTGAIGLVIDGGGSPITTGVKGFLSVPFACTITGWTLLSTDGSATSGSIVVDLWKDTYANYPPTAADVITASAKPTLSSANKNTSTTLTGWTTSIAAGDVLGFNVNSATTVTKVALTLTVTVP